LNRFRVAFASLLTFAMVTSAFAGWGLLGYATPFPSLSGGPEASSSSASSTSLSSHNPTSQSSEVVSMTTAIQSASTTLVTTSVQTSSSTVNSATVTGTMTSTVGGPASTVTTVVTATAVVTTTAVSTAPAGGGTTTAVVTVTSTAAAGGAFTFAPVGQGESLLMDAQRVSLFLAPVSWVLLGGAWIWRGRVRSRYTEMGFGSDVFELFMKMKGGATRIKVLNTLNTPKDRLQLAEELGVDWKTVDRHVQILNRYGFVREQAAYGTVRLYEVTPIGKMLLNLFEDLERNDGPVTQRPRATPRRQEDDRPDP
jgi:hypothetical protein